MRQQSRSFDLVNHFVIAIGEQKRQNPRIMNPQKTILPLIATLSVSIALADDFKAIDGKEYKDSHSHSARFEGLNLLF